MHCLRSGLSILYNDVIPSPVYCITVLQLKYLVSEMEALEEIVQELITDNKFEVCKHVVSIYKMS